MRCLIVVLIGLNVSCGVNSREIDPRLQDIVMDFEIQYQVYVNYKVTIQDIPYGRDGYCRISKGVKLIVIREGYYLENMDREGALHQLLYHELGHCSLNLGHNNNLNRDGMPESIMYHETFGGSDEGVKYYIENLEYYMESLRDRRMRGWK